MADYTATAQFPLRLGVMVPDMEAVYVQAMRNAMGEYAQALKPLLIQRLHRNTPVMSGALWSSAATTRVKRVGTRRIGFTFNLTSGNSNTKNSKGISYPQFVEYGTYKMTPRGYMAKTAQEAQADLEQLLSHLAEVLPIQMADVMMHTPNAYQHLAIP